MFKTKKIIIGTGVGVLIIILVLVKVLVDRNSKPKNLPKEQTQVDLIPTVDASVEVDLKAAVGGKDVVLSIKKIPRGTDTIDYELSYETEKQGLQGVIGTIKADGEEDYEKQLTLGTCSSGTCVYHQVTGKIKLNLKFSGDYGERIFEKEFSIN